MNQSNAGRRHTPCVSESEGMFHVPQRAGQPGHDHIEFLFGQTQKLRNSLASVRSLSEILYDNSDIDLDLKQKFLAIIIQETEKLTQMIEHMPNAPFFCQLARPV